MNIIIKGGLESASVWVHHCQIGFEITVIFFFWVAAVANLVEI
jgi:hypothetical protein